jgi:hypothetical protein
VPEVGFVYGPNFYKKYSCRPAGVSAPNYVHSIISHVVAAILCVLNPPGMRLYHHGDTSENA